MNIVHLSGTAASNPLKVSRPGESTHVTFPLNVTHHTKAGIEKHESYFMNAWRGIGDKALDKIANGSNVVIQGYLSQSWNNGVPNTEVTITEFVASPRAMIVSKPSVSTPVTQAFHEKPPVSASPLGGKANDSTATITKDEMTPTPTGDTPGNAADSEDPAVSAHGITEETEPENELPVEAEDEETSVPALLDGSEEQEQAIHNGSDGPSEYDNEQTGASSDEQCA